MALPAAGAELGLVIRPTSGAPLSLRVTVIRRTSPYRSAASVASAGFAAEILWAPEAYYALLLTLGSA